MSGGEKARVVPLRRKARCPVCSRPVEAEHRPFCSRKCTDMDLARWFGGAYRIPTEDEPDGEAAREDEQG